MDAGFDAVSVLDFDKFEFQVIEKGLKDDGESETRPLFRSPV